MLLTFLPLRSLRTFGSAGVVLLALSACVAMSPERAALQRAWVQQRSEPEHLRAFFRRWEEALPPLTAGEVERLPAAQRAVYEIFAIIYTPGNLDQISSDLDHWVHDVPYYVVQNSIDYEIVDRLLPPWAVINKDFTKLFEQRFLEQSTIEDFRPHLDLGDKRAVFLNEAYDKAVGSFLEEKGSDLLRDWMTVTQGFSGGAVYNTPPFVQGIQLDETLTKASVTWWIGDFQGQVYFERTESGWEMTLTEEIGVV
jgi:hypothetical protein